MAHDDFIPSDDFPEYIDHAHTDEIVCPYCGYTFQCSYELDGESGRVECEECEEEFEYFRNIEVSYNTYKLKK